MIFLTRIFMRIFLMNNGLIYGTAVLLLLVSSWLAYWLEPDTFGRPFHGFWWVMTTVTTTGYGDYYPHTIAGKCLGIFLYIFGIGLLSITITKVAGALFVYRHRKEEGKLKFTGKHHFVIVDWSKHAELATQQILQTDPKAEVVIIDTLEKTPIQHPRVHYIQGNPVKAEVLESANLAAARAVFIFANDVTENYTVVRDPSFIDGKTLLIATAIERNYSHVHTIVEIKDEQNLPNFQHVKIDEFILGHDTISQLAVRSAFHPGTSNILSQLLKHGQGEELHQLRTRPEWKTYRDAFVELLQEGATLIADGTQLSINRRLEEEIPAEASLFVICDEETYRRLRKIESATR
ncbi:potassium channel protein [Tumebacillus permanentifrigoris]|uniref:Voltage-gated potassium channel n=1 Tax=Tumebacillus permanentifrigoris TaxID=378543 RepID=A0A316D8V1_9BACL|nr:potassium channel protein [Tumebacillus permanentifrigoris]PWK07442.1 voltage-gated potassium channel [Tumebacillus permanentifrigoris]